LGNFGLGALKVSKVLLLRRDCALRPRISADRLVKIVRFAVVRLLPGLLALDAGFAQIPIAEAREELISDDGDDSWKPDVNLSRLFFEAKTMA
jgi:hypothetical protein